MEKNDETKVKKDSDVEDTDNKEGKDKCDRVKKAEKNDEKEEEADSDSDTISINSDFFAADDIEVEICWM
jgi:hypothetical protein